MPEDGVKCEFFTIVSIDFLLVYNKQISHAFLFNIRNYSPQVITIQRRESELNMILLGVNSFGIRHGIVVSCIPPTPNKVLEDKGSQKISIKYKFF